MRWERLGKIFDPRDHQLAEGCSEFAKAPQAVVCDDYIRVYFSAQKQTNDLKYVSCPQYVDFTRNFDAILRVSTRTIIPLGQLGSFDEHGIFPFNVLRHKSKYYGYSSGWSRRHSVSIDMGIGFAVSSDGGESFKKIGLGGPVMSATVEEPMLVGDPFVLRLNDMFHMWYIFGTKWSKQSEGSVAERHYKIAHAISKDGVHWLRDGKEIVETSIADECQALPCVIRLGCDYHMFFCYRGAFGFRDDVRRSYRIGHAVSSDLVDWQRADNDCILRTPEADWDSDMQCYPNVFECDGKVYLLYNGNEFGRYGFGLAILVND